MLLVAALIFYLGLEIEDESKGLGVVLVDEPKVRVIL